MKHYLKKTISVIIIITLCFSTFCMQSCKKTYTKEQQKIEKYIANREFDKARDIALSIPSDAREKHYPRRYYREEAMEKINLTQLADMINNGQLEDAEALSNELDIKHVFWDLVKKNLSKLYTNNFRALYSVLTRYPITTTYHEKLTDYSIWHLERANEYASMDYEGRKRWASFYKEYYDNSNVGYNDEIKQLNLLVMQVTDMAIFDNNVDCIRKMLLLLKPEAVEVSRVKSRKDEEVTNYATITYKLENKAANEVIAKAKQAGINL